MESNAISLEPTENNVGKPSKKRRILGWTSLVLVWSGLGAGFGVYYYKMNNPTNTTVGRYGQGVVASESDVNQALANDNVVEIYNQETDGYTPYSLLNYLLDRQASYDYSLTLSHGATVAKSMGVNVTQEITSGTYSTPEGIFNQNTSGGLVSTANRFYDYLDGNVNAYLCKSASDWGNNPALTKYTYDDYIQSFGKLLQGSYYVAQDKVNTDKVIPETYIGSSYSDYEASSEEVKYHVNAVLIYSINSGTVTESSIAKDSDSGGYILSIVLNSSATTYYSAQMQTTGGLSGLPSFTSSYHTFYLDENLDFVKAVCHDEYSATVGGLISSTAVQDLNLYFFHSDSSTIDGVTVSIPEVTDTDFSGYQLFPDGELNETNE